MTSGNGNRKNLMKIGELAWRAGTTMRTVRYYEERGLIAPAGRTKGGFRLYEEDELRKLHLIKTMQAIDMPLAQVKAFFDERQRGKVASEVAPAIQRVLLSQLEEMDRRIEQYRKMRESVRETIDILNTCSTCSQEPGPNVCSGCPVLTSRESIPLHMQAVIEPLSRKGSGLDLFQLTGEQTRESLESAMAR